MVEHETPENLIITGLLKRIISYEACHNSTTGPSGIPLLDTRITTKLEILGFDDRTIPIDFHSYVGSELVNKIISYCEEKRVTIGTVSTTVGVRSARQELVIQELIPQDADLPNYKASSCIYVG